MDMLFVTCDSVSNASGIGSGCSINIAYNKQLPLCSSSTAQNVKNGKRVCRLPTDLCTADPDFQFNLHEGTDNPVGFLLLYNYGCLRALFCRTSCVYQYPTSSHLVKVPPRHTFSSSTHRIILHSRCPSDSPMRTRMGSRICWLSWHQATTTRPNWHTPCLVVRVWRAVIAMGVVGGDSRH